MSEYKCINCETEHDTIEEANECCACESCAELAEKLAAQTARADAAEDNLLLTHVDWQKQIKRADALQAEVDRQFNEAVMRYKGMKKLMARVDELEKDVERWKNEASKTGALWAQAQMKLMEQTP